MAAHAADPKRDSDKGQLFTSKGEFLDQQHHGVTRVHDGPGPPGPPAQSHCSVEGYESVALMLILDQLGPESPVSEYATEIGKETERVAT
jgi:hypothetical protein